ncbi:MAG TPA: DUF1566 domain-containing protein [Spirochaetota bacterium]|nr:DUF1566 domain-containing protein [Spirochaetota bacterium]HNT10111.1 DUF1566 domain-containing protein [Spirochaetota bacterium]
MRIEILSCQLQKLALSAGQSLLSILALMFSKGKFMKIKVQSVILIGALVMVSAASVVLENEINAQGTTHKIGQKGPAGGWIFYDKGNSDGGWRYLEAAAEDQGLAKWGCSEKTIPGAQGKAIGTGKANTDAIIKHCEEAEMAAKVAVNYQGGGKSDWYLPSIDELALMYKNLHKARVGGFRIYDVYWSSSEAISSNTAWVRFFDKDVQDYSDKQYRKKVRAVRAF